MVRKDGILKLMDFGVAQIMDLERMTVTGQLLGSPAYMAPEILEGKPLDVRTDVFSVGIMLYQLATGRPALHRAATRTRCSSASPRASSPTRARSTG